RRARDRRGRDGGGARHRGLDQRHVDQAASEGGGAMSTAQLLALGPLARAVVGDVVYGDGRPHLPDDRLAAWIDRFAGVGPGRAGVAAELVAFSTRVAREAGEAAHDVVGQLLALAGVLLLDLQRVVELVEVDDTRARSDAARLLAHAWTRLPLERVRAPG